MSYNVPYKLVEPGKGGGGIVAEPSRGGFRHPSQRWARPGRLSKDPVVSAPPLNKDPHRGSGL